MNLKTLINKPAALYVFLTALAGLLFLTAIDGPFIIDEANYMVNVTGLRQGRLSVPGTEGIKPSVELMYFSPIATQRVPDSTPVTSEAPPLYAFFALPFSLFGWKSLVLMNIISFIICGWIIFRFTENLSSSRTRAWTAMLTFLFACYTLEYSQGVWPHCLSTALCTGAFVLVLMNIEEHKPGTALAAGLLTGLALGIRYPNIVFVIASGIAILLFSQRKTASLLIYLGGIIPPLLVSSIINWYRLGSFNPISKGANYMALPSPGGPDAGFFSFISGGLQGFTAKIIDFSFFPAARLGFQRFPDSSVGAHLSNGIMRKSLLQSAPWTLPVLLALLLIWLRRDAFKREAPPANALKSIALVAGGFILLFSLAGISRGAGLCYNQRYLLDMMPLIAVALALCFDNFKIKRPLLLLAGACAGAAAVFLTLKLPIDSTVRHLIMLKLPVLAAVALAITSLPSLRGRSGFLFPSLMAASLMWAAAIHVGDDLYGSRRLRRVQSVRQNRMQDFLDKRPTVILGYWGFSVAMAPLQLKHDVVIVDPALDYGKDAAMMVDEFIRAGRRVLIVANDMPRAIYENMIKERSIRMICADSILGIIEIMPDTEGKQ